LKNRWYFHKLGDGNFSLYNKGAQAYLTLSPDATKFNVAPYVGNDYQRFYVRQFWNGYTINCQLELGYYNYVTVSKNGTVKSQYFNGNPKTQFFQSDFFKIVLIHITFLGFWERIFWNLNNK